MKLESSNFYQTLQIVNEPNCEMQESRSINMSQEKQICRMRAQYETNGVHAETVIAEPPSYLE